MTDLLATMREASEQAMAATDEGVRVAALLKVADTAAALAKVLAAH